MWVVLAVTSDYPLVSRGHTAPQHLMGQTEKPSPSCSRHWPTPFESKEAANFPMTDLELSKWSPIGWQRQIDKLHLCFKKKYPVQTSHLKIHRCKRNRNDFEALHVGKRFASPGKRKTTLCCFHSKVTENTRIRTNNCSLEWSSSQDLSYLSLQNKHKWYVEIISGTKLYWRFRFFA